MTALTHSFKFSYMKTKCPGTFRVSGHGVKDGKVVSIVFEIYIKKPYEFSKVVHNYMLKNYPGLDDFEYFISKID